MLNFATNDGSLTIPTWFGSVDSLAAIAKKPVRFNQCRPRRLLICPRRCRKMGDRIGVGFSVARSKWCVFASRCVASFANRRSCILQRRQSDRFRGRPAEPLVVVESTFFVVI